MASKELTGITLRFREWRAEQGLTLSEVQSAVNQYLPEERQVARSTVNNYESRNPPPATFVAALKKAYPQDVNVNWFLFGGDFPDEPREVEGDILLRVVGRDQQEAAEIFGVAAGVVDEMMADLLFTYPEYRAGGSLNQDLAEPSEKMMNFYDVFSDIFTAPFRARDHFVSLEEMRAGEVRTYAYSMIASLRPLLRVVREDPRPARPISGKE